MGTRYMVGYPCWDEQAQCTRYPVWRTGKGPSWAERTLSLHPTIQAARQERDRLNRQDTPGDRR